MRASTGTWPLASVRVLDLADETAVWGTKLLADLGADVLRIEPPEGDPIRQLGPFADGVRDAEHSLSHWWFNAGKRSAVLDLGSAGGRRQLRDLAREADILVETGDHDLDCASLRAAQPGLTIVTVTGLGLTGPRRDWLAPDLVVWALSGAMAAAGLPARPPLRATWALSSQVAGVYAALAALAGLRQARVTGWGAHFDLSRLEAMQSIVDASLCTYLYAGRRTVRCGTDFPGAVPWGAFPTADGQVILIALTQGQWSTLLAWMAETGDTEAWPRDPALLPISGRTPHRDRIRDWLSRWTRQFSTNALVRQASERQLACAPINTPLDLLRDEQLRFRGFFVPVDQPPIGRAVDWPGLPYQFASLEAPTQIDRLPPRPAPRLGADRPAFDGPRDAAPGTGSGRPDNGPLASLKVLDFTWAAAGPTGTRVFADLGAEVIKVEPRGAGDLLRGLPPFWRDEPHPNRNAFFQLLNRNKRNIALDLRQPAAIAVAKRLAAWADVVVDNFGAGVLERFGLGPTDLAATKPDLVQLSLSGYGQTGPHRHYPSYALTSAARGGLVATVAYPDGALAGPGIAIGDTGAGLQLALAVLAGLEQRRRTGRGVFIDMSQFEAAAAFLGPALLDAAVNGATYTPFGNHLPDRSAAPHGAYPAVGDDRWCAVAVLTEGHWQALVKVMDRLELATDPRFATAPDRVANAAALDDVIGAWTASQDALDLAERLQAAGVPAGAVQEGPDVFERDAQIAARRFYQEVDQPDMGTVLAATTPLRWSAEPVPIRLAAPRLDEYTEAILREVLSLSDEEIAELYVQEAV